jgi:hypothetical protein
MLFWKVAYYFIFVLHYVGTVVAILCGTQLFSPSGLLAWIGYFFAAWLAIFLIANGICGGCPFSYLEQCCEVKAGWRERVTYNLKDSWAHMYIFSRFKE